MENTIIQIISFLPLVLLVNNMYKGNKTYGPLLGFICFIFTIGLGFQNIFGNDMQVGMWFLFLVVSSYSWGQTR